MRAVVARSRPLSHLLALLAKFNLARKTRLLHLREVKFLPCVSLVFLAFHRAAWSHWSHFCWFSQVKAPSPFCLILTKFSNVPGEYSPVCLFWMHTEGYKLIHTYPEFYVFTFYCFQCQYHFRYHFGPLRVSLNISHGAFKLAICCSFSVSPGTPGSCIPRALLVLANSPKHVLASFLAVRCLVWVVDTCRAALGGLWAVLPRRFFTMVVSTRPEPLQADTWVASLTWGVFPALDKC